MPVLLRSRSPLNLPRTPVLQASARRRPCARCGRRVTLFSPSTFTGLNIMAGMLEACGQRAPVSDGQCCVRCTRELRSGT